MLHEILSALTDVFMQTCWILFCLGTALLVIKIADVVADRRKRADRMRREELRHTANREAKRQAARNDADWARRYGDLR